MQSKRFGWCVGVVAIAVTCASIMSTQAQNTYFSESSGYWTNALAWTGESVPGVDDYAVIGSSSGESPATCILDTAGLRAKRVDVGSNEGMVGTIDFASGDITLVAGGRFTIGQYGTGIVNQSGSAYWDNAGLSLTVGQYAGGHGEYNLSGGTYSNSYNLYIGLSGYGELNLSGTGMFWGPRDDGGAFVGDNSNSVGVVNQTGGTWNNRGRSINIGNEAGSSGEYNLTGGVLTNVYSVYIGSSGNGVLNLGGSGALHSSSTWYVGQNAGSTGTVTQTSGTWDMGGAAGNIADQVGSVGSMTISDGVFTNAGSVIVGKSGTGSLTISGGTFSSLGLYIGYYAGSTGVVSIVGSGASSIRVARFRTNLGENAIYRITPDAGGITPVHCYSYGADSNSGKAYIDDAILQVDFSNYDSTDDLLVARADHTMHLPAGLTILTDGWSADMSVVGNDLYLKNIMMPPRGTVVSVR